MLLKTGTNSFFILLIKFFSVLDDEIHSPKRRREMKVQSVTLPVTGVLYCFVPFGDFLLLLFAGNFGLEGLFYGDVC